MDTRSKSNDEQYSNGEEASSYINSVISKLRIKERDLKSSFIITSQTQHINQLTSNVEDAASKLKTTNNFYEQLELSDKIKLGNAALYKIGVDTCDNILKLLA